VIAVNGLLGRYPHSHLKKDTISLLRRLEERSDPDRPARYSVYEVLYAFLQLEARHLGLRRDKHPEQYARFRYEFLASLAMWVPGKDPYIDGVRDALFRAAKHEDAELNSLLEALVQAEASRTSIEQRRRASTPHPDGSFNRYVLNKLKVKPRLTERELIREIEKDYERGGSIFSKIEIDEIEVDDMETGECETVRRGAIRSRLYRLRKKSNAR
jgi:hypothetical protein